jgi:hypothetical protein
MPIKPGRRKQTVKCPECGEKLDVDRRPGALQDPDEGPPAVGSGVTSFESDSLEELTARRKRRGTAFGGGEFGGVGDLLFNPMGGQPAAMNALGAGGSFLIALILLGFLVAFSWFLPLFIGWMQDPAGWFLKDVIAQVPLGAHIGLAVSGLIAPLVLFLLFSIPNALFFRRCTGSQLLLSTMMVFVPFLLLFGLLTLGLLYQDTLRDIAISLHEVFGDGIFSDNENYSVKISLWFVGLVALYATLHPILLVYSSLRTVVGFSERGAFFLTPLVIGLCGYLSQLAYWLAFEKLNLFGVADAFSEVF